MNTKWEYRSETYKSLSYKTGGFIDGMNALGKDFWQFVEAVDDKANPDKGLNYIFKRERTLFR
jgi:hypothetical protein